jgi:hypothetical protein
MNAGWLYEAERGNHEACISVIHRLDCDLGARLWTSRNLFCSSPQYESFALSADSASACDSKDGELLCTRLTLLGSSIESPLPMFIFFEIS